MPVSFNSKILRSGYQVSWVVSLDIVTLITWLGIGLHDWELGPMIGNWVTACRVCLDSESGFQSNGWELQGKVCGEI